MLFAGCASMEKAEVKGPNVEPIKYEVLNLSIFEGKTTIEDFGEYYILKAEANRINARAKAIIAETALKNAIRANPNKYKGVNLPISLYTETNIPSGNLRTVYICNKSSQKVLRVSLTEATVKNEPGAKYALIPRGEKNGKVFLVNDDEFIVYAYTTDFQMFRKPKRIYVPRKKGQAIAWNGDAYDLIVNIHNPDSGRNRYNRYSNK